LLLWHPVVWSRSSRLGLDFRLRPLEQVFGRAPRSVDLFSTISLVR
jgi:hypothetical protein